MHWTATPIELTLKTPFEVAHHRSTRRRSLLVAWTDPDTGWVGRGEAPEIAYAGIHLSRMQEVWEANAGFVDDWMQRRCRVDADARGLWRSLFSALHGLSPLVGAIDAAAWDFIGQRTGQPVWRLLGLPDPAGVGSCYTLGLDAPARMAEKLAGQPGWPAYKIKLGRGAMKAQLAIVERLRRLTDAPFWVDANTGWSAADTRWMAPRLAALGVVMIEQPTPPYVDDALGQWIGDCPLPVFADESCQQVADVRDCAARGYTGVNIKPAKCGGLTPAAVMLEEAVRLNLRTMVGCMVESAVGISAIAQLAGAVDYADLDGATLIEPTRFVGAGLDRGRLSLGRGRGGGGGGGWGLGICGT